MSRRHQGKLDKDVFELENRKYFDSIGVKPTLCLEISSVDKSHSHCVLSIRNAIVLSIFERYLMSQWVNINVAWCSAIKSEQKGGKSSNLAAKKCVVDNGDSDIDFTDEEENRVLVQYESPTAFQNGILFQQSVHDRDVNVGHVGSIKQPSIVVSEKRLIISGLSSVVRFLLKFCSMRLRSQIAAEKSNENLRRLQFLQQQLQDLMGFRGGCLQACAETSLWTKFCEVDVIRMVVRILVKVANSTLNSKWEVAKDLMRFEYHLSQPVRIHNFRKRVQAENHKLQLQQQITTESNNKEEASDLSHSFAEGPDMTLSDLILYHCFKIAMDFYGEDIFTRYLPKTSIWFKSVRSYFHSEIAGNLAIINLGKSVFYRCNQDNIVIPEVPFESLYKTDPSRNKSKMRLYTRQEDIENAVAVVFSFTRLFEIKKIIPSFDWSTIPLLAQPEGGQLPEKRKNRKCHQLANLAQEVMTLYERKIKSENVSTGGQIRIVDFCSGGGHLGILLAWLLPKAQVILVENKEDSVRRAEERVDMLKLTNVFLQQSNLNYFDGQFDIGVALHACGSATDMVLEKCIAAKASFVCCPCCYGAIQSNHMLHYPRSSTFRNNNISLSNYFVLGHSADQTHENSAKSDQGKNCMRIVDTDRLLFAQELGYVVTLKRMVPETASPKNHILVGVCNKY